MALDTLVLRLKSLKVDNIYTFPYVKVPDRKALEQSVETLQMIGGLS
jgi:HrpA-like RNA helicase